MWFLYLVLVLDTGVSGLGWMWLVFRRSVQCLLWLALRLHSVANAAHDDDKKGTSRDVGKLWHMKIVVRVVSIFCLIVNNCCGCLLNSNKMVVIIDHAHGKIRTLGVKIRIQEIHYFTAISFELNVSLSTEICHKTNCLGFQFQILSFWFFCVGFLW